MSGTAIGPSLKERLAADLEEARRRTEDLLRPLSEEQLTTQYDALMSPPVWDYAHIGVFEELWLVQRLSGAQLLDEGLMHVYNPLETPRVARGRARLMGRTETARYRDAVRDRALALLEEVDVAGPDPLLRDGFVYELVIQHEHQHDETILQEVQLMPAPYRVDAPKPPTGRAVDASMVSVPRGEYPIGSDSHEPYDNEHPRHLVTLEAFEIDRFPVTNGDFLAFIEDGGYGRPELWSAEGWEWRSTFDIQAPEYWSRDVGRWRTTRNGAAMDVNSDVPVCHVSWFEAEAFARWMGKRLPTELEWEVAAGWDPARRSSRRYPWGDQPPTPSHANLDQRLFAAAPVGAFPDGASALGCEQMLGDVWEWTSSDFQAYPGFQPFPYPEYSVPFFGAGFKVLRGGSWASRARVARNTFRNWDSRLKRQIFSGFRCARDAR
jgi:gamma-glutamyl hercynylcysteine S-oxide synthase